MFYWNKFPNFQKYVTSYFFIRLSIYDIYINNILASKNRIIYISIFFSFDLIMLPRGHSRSFAEKPPLPNVLPPLQKKGSNIEDIKSKVPNSTRPTFVIRSKLFLR